MVCFMISKIIVSSVFMIWMYECVSLYTTKNALTSEYSVNASARRRVETNLRAKGEDDTRAKCEAEAGAKYGAETDTEGKSSGY